MNKTLTCSLARRFSFSMAHATSVIYGPNRGPSDLKEKIKERQKERHILWKAKREERKRYELLLKKKKKAIACLRKEGKNLKKSKETVLKIVRPLISKDEFTILKSQLDNSTRKSKRYTDEYKSLIISLSYKSTAAYNYLSKRLNLPTKKTVTRWLSKITFREGFDPKLFELLKERVQYMPESSRVVSLLMDEMSLKELERYDGKVDRLVGLCPTNTIDGSFDHAKSALVFMIQGLRGKGQQSVAFFFS